MTDFLQALTNPDVAFLRYALIAGLLASVSFGVIGTYVVARRISYIAGAISHCVLGGIGLALFLRRGVGMSWVDPMHGAVVAAVAAALVLGLVTLYSRQREDTVIGALWSIGMAAGLLFLSHTPGYVDPMSYLFGDILMITRRDLWLIGALDILVVVLAVYFYNKFLAVCFDEEFARLRGIRVHVYFLLLLCLTALTVVLLVRVVGIVMVIALLTLPAAIAGPFCRKLWQMMAVATVLCMLFTTSGLWVSYSLDFPSGPTIILVAGAVYVLVLAALRVWRKAT